MNHKKILFSSKAVCIFIAYVLYIWMADFTRFVAFYAGISMPAWASALIAGVLWCPVAVWMGKHCKGEPIPKVWGQIFLFFLWFFLFFMLRAIFPDSSEDVKKYHVLLQEPVWRDTVGYDLIPGAMQGFGFPLPDRLFYPFRLLLGYRMGQAFNLLCLFILYLQVIQLLVFLAGDRIRKFTPVLTFCIVGQYDMMMQTASYMVELCALIILLEGLWFLLRKPETKAELFWFALLMGLLFAMKMTNVIYVAPMLLLYLWKNRNQVTAKLFAVCFLGGALPVSIYLIHNYVQVLNPVFPYYNTIFQSPYFSAIDFKDNRWGAQNWKETVLWPFLAILKPKYRQSELPNPWTWGYALSWVLAAVYGVRCFWKRRPAGEWYGILAVTVLASSYLWSFTTGHARYYMGGFVILMIWGVACGCRWISEKMEIWMARYEALKAEQGGWRKGRALFMGKWTLLSAAVFCSFMIMLRAPMEAIWYCLSGYEWSFRPPLSSQIYPGGFMTGFENRELYQDQLSKVGKDRSIGTEEQRQRVDRFVLFGSDAYLAVLFDPTLPICSWNSVASMFQGECYDKAMEDVERWLSEERTAALFAVPKGHLPDLSGLQFYHIDVDSIEPVLQDIFWDQDVYLVFLKNPEPEMRNLDWQQKILFPGETEMTIGQAETGQEVTLWLSSQSIKSAPGLTEESLRNGKLEIFYETPVKTEDPETPYAVGLSLLKEIPVDCRQPGVTEVKVKVPDGEGWPEGWEKISLKARLTFPEEDQNVAALSGFRLKTSLTGPQYLDEEACYIGEEGRLLRGWYDAPDGNRYYMNYYGDISQGWRKMDGKWYYFSALGHLRYNTWKDDSYVGPDGAAVTGKQVIDGVAYEFDEDGQLISE